MNTLLTRGFKHTSLAAKYLLLRARLATLRLPPIIVASTHRSGSTALYRSLRNCLGNRVFKCHRLNPALMTMLETKAPMGNHGLMLSRMPGDWAIHQAIVAARRPALFVMMVRDPIAVAASMAALEREPAVRERPHWPLCPPFSTGMTAWFEGDVGPALDWHPWSTPFDHARRASTVMHDPWRILLLRADLDDRAKERELAAFVGSPVTVVRTNSAQELGKRSDLERVTEAIRAQPEGVDAMLGSMFTRHFFSEEERASLRARWAEGTTASDHASSARAAVTA